VGLHGDSQLETAGAQAVIGANRGTDPAQARTLKERLAYWWLAGSGDGRLATPGTRPPKAPILTGRRVRGRPRGDHLNMSILFGRLGLQDYNERSGRARCLNLEYPWIYNGRQPLNVGENIT
jgi:hypothetical protein